MVGIKFTARRVEKALRENIDPEKAKFYPRFFKAGKGEYAEGDQFLGVIVPQQRKIARRFRLLPTTEIQKLLDSPFHECRLTGILILVDHFQSAELESARKKIYDCYLKNADRVNNWDLVDSSAHKIVGAYLLDKEHQPLFKLARARHLWKNRIAIIATLEFIKHDQFDTTLELSQILLNHPHDLIHKAVGWMLREVGKRNETPLLLFLQEHAPQMPRTMLRYAIEKLSPAERKRFMTMKR
jgi:3-methyladenine DNA glycosylase AlkD